jgi:hypothetical protein
VRIRAQRADPLAPTARIRAGESHMKAVLIACLALLCQPAPQGTRLAEPQQEFVLQANGKECELRIGLPTELPKEFAGQKVTLRVRPTRLFDYQGLRFRYPQSYRWEYESKESGGQFVTLAGHTNVLQLSVYNDRVEAGSLVDSMARAIAAQMGTKTETSTCELSGKDKRVLKGQRLSLTVAGQKSTQEVYAMRLGDEVVALVVQDTCSEDGKPDPETTRLLDLFADSLEWPK